GLMNDDLANRADEFVETLDAEGQGMDTAKFLAAGVSRILAVDANLDEGKLTEALTECIVKRIGTPVLLSVGSALVQRYRADGRGQLANVVTAEDDGVLTIDREARWYKPGGRTVPMSRPLRVHRDLISPPPFGDPSSNDGEFYFTSTPSEVHARGGGIDLREAARTDREFARDDVEEIAKDRLGDVSDAVVAALDGEADRVVREAMAHSPANGSVPVRFIIAGHSGKPVGCKLTDIELPHATATVSSRQGARSARINVYTRGGWEFIKNP
ncbi:MAG: hypothetical protein KDB26_12435, partial [Microthrixaceae bacterium]|nr:hypothetical protein [Microthrixaceae bacterium]